MKAIEKQVKNEILLIKAWSTAVIDTIVRLN